MLSSLGDSFLAVCNVQVVACEHDTCPGRGCMVALLDDRPEVDGDR
jgi:hypothetical protein